MRFTPLVVLMSALLFAASAPAAVIIDFEASEGYVPGPISDSDSGTIQGGWSGGAQTYFTHDSTDLEEIVSTEAFSGSNSWHAARYYGSSGQGTPFSPSLGLPPGTGPGKTFTVELYFKAGSASGDSSIQNVYLGTYTGTDRTGFNVYLQNDPAGDGLHVFTYDWIAGSAVPVTFSTNLDRTAWHKLFIRADFFSSDPALNVFTYTVDDTDTFTGSSWPNPWRVSMGFTPVWGDTLKFANANGPHTSELGFYYDQINFDVSPVPEPSTFALIGTGLLAIGLLRRRRRAGVR